MLMATPAKLWTVDEVRAIPDDGRRYEVVDGELFVTPGPSWRHGDAVLEMARRLMAYLDAHPVGHLKIAPQDVTYGRHTLVEPDLFVVPLVAGRRPRTWEEAGRLLLAIEVLSPSTARLDRTVKRRLFQREGVPEYWIVDVDARVVERWRPADERPEVVSERLDWRPDGAGAALELDLPAYFAEVTGEA
jgi:Uma2 family endonuclease